MRKLIFVLACLVILFSANGQDNSLKVETYTLSNGLTVYLNVDHTMPMVHGMVAVKGGSKRDPADATGIAHYFEHIMFKGTDQLGTIDYKSEKVYLDSIAVLYDSLGNTTNDKQRLTIQKEINRITIKSAQYAIPNEIDKILTGMGGKDINAQTGQELIAYYNSFPANQIEKWLEVYCHRFINPVFRLFQSELETVYEEKNMYADDAFSNLFEEFNRNFYKNTSYAIPVIGLADDLKNPSLSKMADYFNTYYVANNMALILTGDFDPEMVKPIIKEKFGKWRLGPEPASLQSSLVPFKGREQVTKRMTPIKVGLLGFRSIPNNSPDALLLEVCGSLLSNSTSTGLLDELRDDNKLLFAGTFEDWHTEFGGNIVFFVPKVVGQSLKSAEDEVLAQINKLKTGDFSDELLQGVITEMQKQSQRWLEDMRWRTYSILDVFVYDKSWDDILSRNENLGKITKAQIIEIAKKYYGNNYMAFYSKMGVAKKDKINKPPFEPIAAANSEKKSEYAQKIEAMPTVDLTPRFIDFEKDVNRITLAEGVQCYVAPNPINKLFTLRFVFGKGNYADPLVSQAVRMLEYAVPDSMKLKEFKKQLQLLGCDFSSNTSLSSTTIQFNGLDQNLDETLKLINRFLNNLSVEQDQLKKLANDLKMDQKYEADDIWTKSDALVQYTLYGDSSEYKTRLTYKQVKALQSKMLLDKINEVMQYQAEVHYCGTKTTDEFKQLFTSDFQFKPDLKQGKGKIEMIPAQFTANTIILVNDKKAVQSHINFYVDGEINNDQQRVQMEAFNDYLDGNMSSIIFQEIREFRSLAYGSMGRYEPSYYFSKAGHFEGWLSTQADKTVDAIEAYTHILNELPQKPERINNVKKDLTLSINAQQTMFRSKSITVSNWMNQGYNKDPRELHYQDYGTLTFDDINSFYKTNVAAKPIVITIIGDKSKMNLDELAKYGTIKEVKAEDLFSK